MIEFDAETAAFLARAYKGRDFVQRRRANLDALAPRRGESILDIGCGGGQLLADIALAVGPKGTATGIDPSDDMLRGAKTATAEFENVRLAQGMGDTLPCADHSLDAIVSVQVFEYIADLAPTLAECARVLKPGGRLIVGDMHFGTLVWHADDQPRMDAAIDAYAAHCAHQDLPAAILPELPDAGFRHDAAIPLTITDTGPRPDGMAAMMEVLVAGFARSTGRFDAAEADAWRADLNMRAAQGRYFFSMTHVITRAIRV